MSVLVIRIHINIYCKKCLTLYVHGYFDHVFGCAHDLESVAQTIIKFTIDLLSRDAIEVTVTDSIYFVYWTGNS